MAVFEKWEAMNKRVEKVLKKNKSLYNLFFRTEKLFNQFEDFFCLKELLVYYLMGSEIKTLEFKREVKHFLKEELQSLKLRKEEEDREIERINSIFKEREVINDEEWECDSIQLVDDEFPF
jgi:hypothetical protein|nr:MAG TPA: hypothetical protein [Caudoviricetes sp.]